MIEVIHESKITKARKDHYCDASHWIRECGLNCLPKMTFAEYRQILIARDEYWMIRKGQPYVRQRSKDGGDIFTFKARPEIHAICVKYDFYPQD
jgi:hypothetical protein